MSESEKTEIPKEEQKEHPPFYLSLKRILTTTHHKDIGVMYIVTAFFFFFLAGVSALFMRAELARPGAQIIEAAVYNSFLTLHGSTMIFLWIIPVFVGFANYLLPTMIGAKDMYFPKLNALGFWILPIAGALFWLGRPGIGWTGYAPLSVIDPGIGVDMWILAMHLVGTSSIIGAFNFLATIFKLRKPGMSLKTMPIFVWSMLVTSFLVLAATPVLAIVLSLLLLDRNFGTGFFLPGPGGDPILWQHLFWFYSHPAVYIMILPGMGLISEIIPRLARKKLYGHYTMVLSLVLIGVLGFAVWAHHMFTSGLSISARIPFMFMTMAIAIPSGIKVFNWVATMYGGRLKLEVPMLFAISFVGTFIVAGVTGVFTASIPLDYALHDTYFVVGHLHFILFGASTQAVFAAVYYYFPYMTKKMYNQSLAKLHFIGTSIGLYVTFFAFTALGLEGMPRRVVDYLPELMPLNQIATFGAIILAISQLVLLYNLLHSWLKGRKAEDDPWQLAKYGLRDYD